MKKTFGYSDLSFKYKQLEKATWSVVSIEKSKI